MIVEEGLGMAAGENQIPAANVGRLVAGTLVMEGRFQISQVLSVAGLRALYLALDMTSNQPRFVLEFALPSQAQRPGSEVSLVRYHHPLLPGVGEYYAASGVMLIALNLAEGTVLADVLERQPGQRTSEAQAIDWGLQLCDGLSYLHTQTPPTLVADLAPPALVVTATGQLKLVGLGAIIRLYTPAGIIGALEPGYAAPEVYAGRMDERSDIYALGALLHRILSGADPSYYASGSLPLLRTLRPDVSPEIEAAVARALELDPAARWPDAASFAEALRLSPAAKDAEPPNPWPEPGDSGAFAAAAAGALAEPSAWDDEHAPPPTSDQWHDPMAHAEAPEEAGIVPDEVFGDRGRIPAASLYSEYPPAPEPPAAPVAPPQPTPAPAAQPAPPAPSRQAVAPTPARRGGFFGRLFGGGQRQRRTPQEVAATGTVMLPRRIQRKRRYTITIRIVGKHPEEVHAVAFTDAAQVSKRDLGKLVKGARITVEATQAGNAFDLPQPRVTLDVPAPDALSEARMPLIGRRVSPILAVGDQLTFTFRGPHGEVLHSEPFSADVVIVEARSGDVTSGSADLLTLAHSITVLV
jgi:serine/threonine protein kinase